MAQLSEEDIGRIADAVAMRLTQGEGASAVARAAAYTAVQERDAQTWAKLGYNLADVKDRERLHHNLAFIEMLRKCSSNVADAITKAIAVAVVLAILAWIAIGAKFSLASAPVKP